MIINMLDRLKAFHLNFLKEYADWKHAGFQ